MTNEPGPDAYQVLFLAIAETASEMEPPAAATLLHRVGEHLESITKVVTALSTTDGEEARALLKQMRDFVGVR